MEIDHLFIFSAQQGIEADALVAAGLTEGSSRVHPGQGTVNRKFYFDNCFLEVLWVHDEAELRSGPAAETGLWERANFAHSAHSRFGICWVRGPETDALFADAQPYQPDYFPAGMLIENLPFRDRPALPWMFRLPFLSAKSAAPPEPRAHELGLKRLTNVLVEVPAIPADLAHLAAESILEFRVGESPRMSLVFDQAAAGKRIDLPELSLVIRY
jgi:hypothetical protein